MQLAPYLFFDGTCEEALAFYGRVFGGDIVNLSRYEGSPLADAVPSEQRGRVMHASFEAPGISLMAADGESPAQGMQESEMRRVALSIASDDREEGRRIFDALAEGGTVRAPYEKQFWGASFGMLVDRFGIVWMVNAGS